MLVGIILNENSIHEGHEWQCSTKSKTWLQRIITLFLQIKRIVEGQMSNKTIRRVLESENIKNHKLVLLPCLKPLRKEVDYREPYIICDLVIKGWMSFSMVKKWNIEASCRFKYYWFDFRKEPRRIFSRQHESICVMISEVILFMVRRPEHSLVNCDNKNYENYQETLANNLLLVSSIIGKNEF